MPDLLFAQGLSAACDRLWQIDLARKRGSRGRFWADGGLSPDRLPRLSGRVGAYCDRRRRLG
jgi:acyl-homoserine lactone acylase PvdQ